MGDRLLSDLPIPPGEYLMEIILGEIAARANLPLEVMKSLITGENPITAGIAVELERVYSVPAHIWLDLEQRYQEVGKRHPARLEPKFRDVLTTLIRAAGNFSRHHAGHHPTECIDGCSETRCGQEALSLAVAVAREILEEG